MDDDPSALPPVAMGAVRVIVAGLGGILSGDGLATAQQASTYEGAAMILIAGAWSIYAHWKANKKLKAAIAAPRGASS